MLVPNLGKKPSGKFVDCKVIASFPIKTRAIPSNIQNHDKHQLELKPDSMII